MRAVNVKLEKCTHYCGRKSSYRGNGKDCSFLGNPYPVGYQNTRSESIELFRIELNEHRKRNSMVWRYLISIPEDAVLGCFCKPQACHCDVLIAAWKWHHKNAE